MRNSNLHGSVPVWIGDVSSLMNLDLSFNSLTSTIPFSLSKLENMTRLFLGSNQLTGGVEFLQYLKRPYIVDLGFNSLSGSVPANSFRHAALKLALLSNNKFTGQLDFLKDARINLVDISNNAFSGPLFPSIFTSYLNTFAATGNCFTGNDIYIYIYRERLIMLPTHFRFVRHVTLLLNPLKHTLRHENKGTLPNEVCSSEFLQNLVLDGLHTSPACIKRIFPNSGSMAYTLPKGQHMTGTIPSCLFSLPMIELIHLSGNQLTGSGLLCSEETIHSLFPFD